MTAPTWRTSSRRPRSSTTRRSQQTRSPARRSDSAASGAGRHTKQGRSMPDLVVIVPSRERPVAAHELADAFDKTTRADTQLCFVIDKRDAAGIDEYPFEYNAATVWQESTTMVEALNLCALDLVDPKQPLGGVLGNPFALGFMGDDHRPRSVGWDELYLDKLRE